MGGSMRWLGAALALALAGCTPGGSSDGGGGEGGMGGMGGGGGGDAGMAGPTAPARLGDAPASTLAHGAALGALSRIAGDPGFDAARMGDPAAYLAEGGDTPTDPAIFASVYYQSSGLATAVEGSRDRRPGIEDGDDAGSRIASRVATAIQLGAVAEGDPIARGGARWHALQSARRLDAYTLYAGWQALDERSAAGFDRFLGLLWTAGGSPQGTGARLAAIDAACGTDHLGAVAEALSGARGPFATALDEVGLLDPLDRRVIREGDSPEYDAAIVSAIEAVADGLAVGLVRSVRFGFGRSSQAEALGALDVIAADLRAADPMVLDMLGVALDSAEPDAIDREAAASAITGALGVDPCEP